jgi:hypothetical protein
MNFSFADQTRDAFGLPAGDASRRGGGTWLARRRRCLTPKQGKTAVEVARVEKKLADQMIDVMFMRSSSWANSRVSGETSLDVMVTASSLAAHGSYPIASGQLWGLASCEVTHPTKATLIVRPHQTGSDFSRYFCMAVSQLSIPVSKHRTEGGSQKPQEQCSTSAPLRA